MALTGPVTSNGKYAQSKATSALLVIGLGVNGLIVGAFLGHMFLPHFVSHETIRALVVRAVPGLPPEYSVWLPAAAGAVLGFALGAISSLFRRPPPARDAAYRQKAAALDRRFSAASDPAFAEKLKALFPQGDNLDARNVVRARPAGIEFAICDLHFEETRRVGRGQQNVEVAQTVAYFEAPDLRVPQFEMRPEGFVLNLLWGASGVEDIDFPSHPQFSKAYYLCGVHADRVRRLFNPRVLDALARHPGFTIESHRNGIVIYRAEQLCEGEALKGFRDMAAELFRLFEDAARKAGMTADAPPPPKEITRALIEKMTGPMGELMREDLVTREDVEAFTRQAPPRKIPPNLLAYVDRQAPQFFMGLGIVFAAAGIAFTIGFASQAVFGTHGSLGDNIKGVLFGLVFAAIGSPIAFFSMRARHRIKRLLRLGQVGEATIEGVESTGVRVNSVERFAVAVRYRANGQQLRALSMDIGHGDERARSLAAAGKPAPLLYDPDHPERIVLLDALLSYSPKIEE